MLYVNSVGNTRRKSDHYDQVWLIVQSPDRARDLLDNPKFKWVPDLSPTKSLFLDHLKWRKSGNWNLSVFQNYYKPRFLSGLRNKVSMDKVSELKELIKTQDICIACYCDNESLCHRSIVNDIVNNRIIL